MQTDATAFIALTQRHPEEARREFAKDLLVEISQSKPSSSSVRWSGSRLRETFASAWIDVVCAWHSIQARHAPSRC